MVLCLCGGGTSVRLSVCEGDLSGSHSDLTKHIIRHYSTIRLINMTKKSPKPRMSNRINDAVKIFQGFILKVNFTFCRKRHYVFVFYVFSLLSSCALTSSPGFHLHR